jgi:hypothetical protein
MPLDNFITRPDYSRQLKQYANTDATFSGTTNILQKLSVKSIEIDTAGANDGDALVFDSIANKFSPNTPGSLGSRIIGGLILTYNSGLTYNVSQGTYRINSTLYGYTGGTIDISSGLTSGSRFDVVFITSAATALVSAGTTAINPFIPQINVSGGELQIGIIFVIPSFTGGVGTTIIQSTGSTFEFNNATASAGIQRQGGVGAAATGDYSFASNFQAKASGNYSSAIGYYAEATGTSQTVVGQYNTPDEGYFIVGNGTSPSSRSNAFRITTGGSVYVTNKLFVSNVEVETTGASSNHALIYDGTKFKSQLLTLQKITESGNTTTNSIGVNQLSGTSIFLSSGFTFISGYNSYSNPSELRVLLADDLGSREASTDTYQLNYFTENVTKGINPLTRGTYSAFTTTTSASYIVTATSITVGKESFVKITGITSGDTAIGTIFRNRFQTNNYNATNTLDNSSKNLVGTAFFTQLESSRFNTSPVLGTMMETHLLGSQKGTSHFEVRNLHLGFFNRGWTDFEGDPGSINVTKSIYDIYINRPVINDKGYNSFNNGENIDVNINSYASIFIESKTKISNDDVLSRPLNTAATLNFTNRPWSLFAEADRAYIGSTLVLASAQTLTSTTRGAWLDIGASQETRPHINLSAGTDPSSPQSGDLWWNGTQLYFRSGSTSINLLSGGTGSSSTGSTTGLTTGTNLGDGVKVLFSSNTTNLAFATLSSLTPSTLRIISSSTGVILFSASTGSGGTLTGNFVPLTGTTSGSPMQGNLVFSGTNGIIVQSDDFNIRNSLTSLGLTLGTYPTPANPSVLDLNINITPAFGNLTSTQLSIYDTATGSGSIVSVPDIDASQANKFVKVKSDGTTGFDFHDDFITITYNDALTAAQDQTGTGTLIPDRWYRIEAIDRGADETTDFNTYGDIFLKAISNNRFSPDGYLLAINADYQGKGDYSDTGGFTNNAGVGYNGLVIDITTDVIIFNNRHWYPTGFFGNPATITSLNDITSLCTPLTKDYTTKNGYVIEAQKIVYDILTNTINRMEDNRGNVVNRASIENFKFGDDLVYNNTVLTPQGFAINNFPITNIQNNIINQGTIYDLNFNTRLSNQNIDLDIIDCSINDVNFTNVYNSDLKLSGCSIQDGKIVKIGTNNITITSSTLVLDNVNSSAVYEYIINATGGTFNGIITAITQNNILPFTTRHRIYNDLTVGTITFKNGTDLKTEGGLDVVLNRYDNVEFSYGSLQTSILYQTDINNYI